MHKEKRWHKLESGQALMEYWPTIPAAIAIIIGAGLVASFVKSGFGQTADVLNRSSASIQLETCEVTDEGENGTDSEIIDRHLFELVSTNYDGTNTTVVYRVSSAEKQSLSHWTLGIPQAVADNIVDQSEPWEWTNNDPTTGAVGVKFDTGYDSEGSNSDSSDEENGNDKPKGNNGVGNGEDLPPPGNPPVNDGEGTSPGNPGNQGGANNDNGNGKPKGNNGVGNGEDPQPPGNPPINDGEGTSPGNPGNQGGALTDIVDEVVDEVTKGNKGKNKKNSTLTSSIANLYLLQETTTTTIKIADGEVREIYLLLSGKYDFGPVTVTTKSGNADGVTGTISAPIKIIDDGHTTETHKEDCD